MFTKLLLKQDSDLHHTKIILQEYNLLKTWELRLGNHFASSFVPFQLFSLHTIIIHS